MVGSSRVSLGAASLEQASLLWPGGCAAARRRAAARWLRLSARACAPAGRAWDRVLSRLAASRGRDTESTTAAGWPLSGGGRLHAGGAWTRRGGLGARRRTGLFFFFLSLRFAGWGLHLSSLTTPATPRRLAPPPPPPPPVWGSRWCSQHLGPGSLSRLGLLAHGFLYSKSSVYPSPISLEGRADSTRRVVRSTFWVCSSREDDAWVIATSRTMRRGRIATRSPRRTRSPSSPSCPR